MKQRKFNAMLGGYEYIDIKGSHTTKDRGNITELDENRIKRLAQKAQVDPEAPRPNEPAILIDNRNSQPFMALGSFSLFLGKNKSRKTHTNAYIAAVFIRGEKGSFRATLPDDKRTVVYIDTEQSGGEAWDTANKIRRAGQMTNGGQFIYYSLREYTPQERVAIIDHVLKENPTAGVVFIDGIRDLVSNINDPDEATTIATKVLQWTKRHNIHIVCTLHLNKSDNNARGHLGTELVNKAQSIISIEKPGDAPYSVVHFVDGRGRGFLDFALTYDDEGLPVQDSIDELTKPGKTAHLPSDHSISEHCRKLECAGIGGIPYEELIQTVIELYGVGTRKAKMEFVPYLRDRLTLIEKRGGLYHYRAPHQAKDFTEDVYPDESNGELPF